jgi:hypothetical protein
METQLTIPLFKECIRLPNKGKVCSHCKRFKSYKYFYRNSRSPDGYRGQCKDCDSRQQSEIRKRMRLRNAYFHKTEKVCTECGRLLDIECFARDYTKTDNRKSYCKECMHEQHKHRNRISIVKQPTSKL